MEMQYDPNNPAEASAGIFGLPFTRAEAACVLIPVPWEATTSYGNGTAFGPDAILNASAQIDLYDWEIKDAWKKGMFLEPISEEVMEWNLNGCELAEPVKTRFSEVSTNEDLKTKRNQVNELSKKVNTWVYEKTLEVFKEKKIPGILGGDHSVPFGAFQAAAEAKGDFGILHLDAHADLRNEYMGFTDSHASIMRNALTRIPKIKKLVQVGIRDYCDEEIDFIKSHPDRLHCFFDHRLQQEKMEGVGFSKISQEIIRHLPDQVWISFDIDGLDPRYCPHTGTPVPGGLDFNEALSLFRQVAKTGRKIIGFDLVEVAPKLVNDKPAPIEQAHDEWDANVAMRLLYKMCGFAAVSQGVVPWRN